MDDMTKQEIAVLAALGRGDIEPLGEVLDGSSGYLHPALQRRLRVLIAGDAKQTGFRLTIVPHPDLTDVRQGAELQRRKSGEELLTAMAMERALVKNGGNWEAARAEVAEQPGAPGKSTIAARHSKKKDYLGFLKAHGIWKP